MSEANREKTSVATHSHGPTTASEKYLANLCRGSFLSLWSWPNLYRDQKSIGGKDGKEVCDLLVVCDPHVFIFSDKHCMFPDSGNLALDWSRWFKRAVLKSAEQVWGAERWLREHPERVFLDRECAIPLPIKLPSMERAVFHRIVVAHGSGDRSRRELGGSGSLMILPMLTGADHYDVANPKFRPFAVGRIDSRKPYIHVIDDFSLDILLTTLSTVTDFAEYMQKKAILIESGKLGAAAGEEELLAYYLREVDESGEHFFQMPPGATAIFLKEGHWESFQRHPQRIAQLEADSISYNWDGLVEKFSKHLLNGTQYVCGGSISEQEVMLRFLARESRFRRRILSKAITGALQLGDEAPRATRWVPPAHPGEPFYVFLSLKPRPGESIAEYRDLRMELLRACCLATKSKFPDADDIIGIATEPFSSHERSEDIIYLDGRGWTAEMIANAEEMRLKLGLMTNTKPYEINESEYPLAENEEVRKGKNPNMSCTCGSGRKYKKCCGA